jgi:hypothetical protein
MMQGRPVDIVGEVAGAAVAESGRAVVAPSWWLR